LWRLFRVTSEKFQMNRFFARLKNYYSALSPRRAMLVESLFVVLGASVMQGAFAALFFGRQYSWITLATFVGAIALLEGLLYYVQYTRVLERERRGRRVVE